MGETTIFVTILSLVTLYGSGVHKSGEVDTFNKHYSALIAAATCQICRKSMKKILVIEKNMAHFFCGQDVYICMYIHTYKVISNSHTFVYNVSEVKTTWHRKTCII